MPPTACALCSLNFLAHLYLPAPHAPAPATSPAYLLPGPMSASFTTYDCSLFLHLQNAPSQTKASSQGSTYPECSLILRALQLLSFPMLGYHTGGLMVLKNCGFYLWVGLPGCHQNSLHTFCSQPQPLYPHHSTSGSRAESADCVLLFSMLFSCTRIMNLQGMN